MVELFIDGGSFMWPILGIFIVGLVFVGERLMHLISTLKWGDNNSVSKPTEAELKSKWSAIEQKMCFEQLRIARNKKLSETDWWGASDQTMTQKQKDYRK